MSLATNDDESGNYRKKYLQERQSVKELQKKFDELSLQFGRSRQSDIIWEMEIMKLLEKAEGVKM